MNRFVSLGALLVAGIGQYSLADTVSIAADGADSYAIKAEARNGRSGYEGRLSAPGSSPSMNPSGSPVWSYGNPYSFLFTYTAATGRSTWSIDFNRDNDFADAAESVSTTTAALAGKSFARASLWIQGSSKASVSVQSFTLNGFSFGPFSTGNNVKETFFQSSSGRFGDIVASGNFTFSATGGNDEKPRMWLRFGDPVNLVPLPPAAWAGLGTLAALCGGATLRRRRNNAAE